MPSASSGADVRKDQDQAAANLRPEYRDHLMSADLGLTPLDGVGHLITDTAGVGLDSLGRLPGGGEQPLPAL